MVLADVRQRRAARLDVERDHRQLRAPRLREHGVERTRLRDGHRQTVVIVADRFAGDAHGLGHVQLRRAEPAVVALDERAGVLRTELRGDQQRVGRLVVDEGEAPAGVSREVPAPTGRARLGGGHQGEERRGTNACATQELRPIDHRPSLFRVLSASDVSALAARLASIYTGVVADCLDRRGLLRQTLPPELAPLRRGMRLAGPVYPVEGRPHPGHDYDTSIRKILEMLGAVPAGHVVVYQTNDRECSQLGELSVTSLKSRGCVGAIIDGGCRDVAFILEEGFPVFARRIDPQDSVPRWELVAHGDVIEIGGVRIAPGDWVVADADGIVVVPAALIGEIVDEAEAKASVENEIRDAVREGTLPLAAYDEYETF